MCGVLAPTSPALAADDSVLIRNATIINGKSEAPRKGVDVLVENGRITKIAVDIEHRGATIIDAEGMTVLPGLIDCHSHLQSVPGAQLRGDNLDALVGARRLQLRAYLAAGVTTVLDAAAPPSVLGDMRAYVEDTNLGPRIEGLAPIFTPEHGYFADDELRADHYPDLWPPIGEDLSLIDAQLEAAAPFAPIGVKVTVEDGYGPLPIWPLFDDETLAHIKSSAAEHDSPLFVHAIGADEYLRALTLEPRALVHGGFMESSPDDETLTAIHKSGATVISTLAITDMLLLIFQTQRLEEPWLVRLVPQAQRTAAADAEITETMIGMIMRQNSPDWVPDFVLRLITPWFYNERSTAALLASQMAAIKAMYDRGVPIVMGSDMGNWPLFTSLFHAVGSIREMELLEQAGLPRAEVIVAATSRAANLLGKSNSIGSIEVGKRADLIIVDENPLEVGMQALREPAYVMKDGELRTPDGWMSAASSRMPGQ
jgi:imidazolonepropionase-like amidohydrolase